MIAIATQPPAVAAARALTDRIRSAVENLWQLVVEAHETGAWSTLGYASWGEYVEGELTMTRQRSYQLLDQGRVIRGLQEAASTSSNLTTMVVKPVTLDITERLARRISSVLPEVQEEIRGRVSAGEEPTAAVAAAVGAHKPEPRRPVVVEPEPTEIPADEDAGHDLAAELESAAAEVDRLTALVGSLTATDAGREIASLSARYAALSGRLQQEMTTCEEARRQATYQTGLLKKIRTALSVEKNSDILTAIEALKA